MLRSRGDFQPFGIFQRRHIDMPAQRRLREADRNLADDVVVVPAENRMRPDLDIAMQIARGRAILARLALAADAHRLSFMNAGGNFHGDDALAHLPPRAAAGAALIFHDRSSAAAIRAGRHHAEHSAESLLRDATLALTLRTSRRLRARFGAAAFANIADILLFKFDRLFAACRNFLEG